MFKVGESWLDNESFVICKCEWAKDLRMELLNPTDRVSGGDHEITKEDYIELFNKRMVIVSNLKCEAHAEADADCLECSKPLMEHQRRLRNLLIRIKIASTASATEGQKREKKRKKELQEAHNEINKRFSVKKAVDKKERLTKLEKHKREFESKGINFDSLMNTAAKYLAKDIMGIKPEDEKK